MSESTADFREEYLVPSDLTQRQLEKDVRNALNASLTTHAELWSQAKVQGVASDAPLFVLEPEQGVDPGTAAILITLAAGGAKLGVKMANDIWSKIVLPYLVRHYGQEAFKKKKK
jgi:hypothetical protein